MKEEKYLPYNKTIQYSAEVLVKSFQEAMRKITKEQRFEITHEEYIILETIYLTPGILQFEIAQSISMHRSYVCKFLSQLINAGYVTREKYIKGKSQVTYKNYITEEGKAVYKKIKIYITKNLLSVPTEEEMKEIEYISEKLLDLSNKIKNIHSLQF